MRDTDNRYCPRCDRQVADDEASICETHKECGAILMPLWSDPAFREKAENRPEPRVLPLTQEIHRLLVERFEDEMSHAICVSTGEMELHLLNGLKFLGRVEREES